MNKKLKAILEDELVNWVEIKKWEVFEFESDFADYLLHNYSRHREEVEDEEVKEEKKTVVKKTAKKK